MKKKGAVLVVLLILAAWYLYPALSTGEISGEYSDEYWTLEYQATKEKGNDWTVDTSLEPKGDLPKGEWTTIYFFGHPLESVVQTEAEGEPFVHQLDGHVLPRSLRMSERDLEEALEQGANVMIQWTDKDGTERVTSLHFDNQEQ